jgi:hypothetical protein
MATSSYDSIYNVSSTQIVIAVGATLAHFFQPQPGQNSSVVKFVTGGTLEILNAGQTTMGSLNLSLPVTQSAQTLANLSGRGYIMTFGEALSFDGPASFYLSATGSTCIAHCVFGKGQGT